jgi:hypothetical protein
VNVSAVNDETPSLHDEEDVFIELHDIFRRLT